MTLPTPQLDNRSFQSIVDEAKRKIPELLPEWTNHNVSDPGIALIELFAWMTELMLFRLNQVPDAFYTHVLNMIGLSPFSATAATADLTFWLSAATPEVVVIDKGSAVATTGLVGEARVFTTTSDLMIAQPQLQSVVVSPMPHKFDDVLPELKVVNNTRPVRCFPRQDKPAPDDAFYIGFAESAAQYALEITVRGPIQGIGIDPKRPPLVWEASVDNAWVACHVVAGSDTTGGLNQEGRLVLLVPPGHSSEAVGTHSGFWIRAKVVPAKPGQSEYQQSPQITSVRVATVGGTVRAEHSEVCGQELVGISTSKPGQVFRVEHSPVLPPIQGEEVHVICDDSRVPKVWETVKDFVDSGPDSPHVTWDTATGEIRFGPRIRQSDGTYRQHGAIPPEGARIVVSGYRYGGGQWGNVGAGTITSYRGAVPKVARVENLLPSKGGVDAETVEEAKVRGPQTLRAGARAVTAADFERLVRQADATIARVRCLPPRLPGTVEPEVDEPLPGETPWEHAVRRERMTPVDRPGLVRLLLVRNVDTDPGEHQTIDDFELTKESVKAVTEYLDERRILGTTIELRTPYFQGVSIAALVTAVKGWSTSTVQAQVLDALYRFLSPVGTDGDGSSGGWPWEADLNTATVHQLLEAIEGVARVDDVVLFEYDLREQQRVGRGRDVVKLEPHSLFLSAHHRVIVQ